ncbi:Uroporphyrinogen-III synthase HemD [compost metagenome]
MTNFLAALKNMGIDDPVQALKDVRIACIGPVTADTAEKAGLQVDILAVQSTIDSLVAGICAWKIQESSS